MICFKNGNSSRQAVCDNVADGDWDVFSTLLETTEVGNENQLGFYYPSPEITPDLFSCGTWRFDAMGNTVSLFPRAVEARAVFESQCLSMRYHALQYVARN